MGRLDDHAKKRIVELRKAGLSFRKIKKVLELDNIRVTPQAVYLFLKRKNVEPAEPQPASSLQPVVEKGSRKSILDQAGWADDQLWDLLHENEVEQREPARPRLSDPCGGVNVSCDVPPCNNNRDCKEGIKIVSVTSLKNDKEQFGKRQATEGDFSTGPQLGPRRGGGSSALQASISASCLAPDAPTAPQHNPSGKGKAFLPSARNAALIVKRKIVGRAIHLQKKANAQNGQSSSSILPALPFMQTVQPASHPSGGTPSVMTVSLGCSMQTKEVSTQASILSPTYSTTHNNSQWGDQIAVAGGPAASPQSLAEKLDTVNNEIQKLAQAIHLVLERQCRLERQQEQQQRFQEQVLMTLQQLSSTVSPGAVPGNQPCAPYGNVPEPSPSLPNFSQFKMELI